MNLHRMLLARAAEGRPPRVGLIGVGKFGAMYLAQASSGGNIILRNNKGPNGGLYFTQPQGGSELNRLVPAERGYTFLELLRDRRAHSCIGLLAIGTLQIASVRGNAFSHHMTQATYIAHDRLEFLKNLPFSDSRLLDKHYPEKKVTMAGIDFLREYTVTQAGALKRIQYTVNWNDGRNHSVTFSTIRSQ